MLVFGKMMNFWHRPTGWINKRSFDYPINYFGNNHRHLLGDLSFVLFVYFFLLSMNILLRMNKSIWAFVDLWYCLRRKSHSVFHCSRFRIPIIISINDCLTNNSIWSNAHLFQDLTRSHLTQNYLAQVQNASFIICSGEGPYESTKST